MVCLYTDVILFGCELYDSDESRATTRMGTNQLSMDRSICPTVHSSCSVSADRRFGSCEAKESLKWYQDRAMDLGLPCINATIELLADVGLWDKIGSIRSVNCPFTHLRIAEDHPVVGIENDKASEIGEYVVCLAIRQLRSCTWFAAIPGLPSIHCRW